MDMGQKLLKSARSPFFKIGMVLADFHPVGISKALDSLVLFLLKPPLRIKFDNVSVLYSIGPGGCVGGLLEFPDVNCYKTMN
jgi:hypothetical protein